MKKLSILPLLGLTISTSALAGGGNGNGTLVCHINGSGAVSSLFVNANAISAHLAHGDFAPLTFAADMDGDGFGDAGNTIEACEAPSGYVGNTDDCDDGDFFVNPDAEEICGDGIDNDCDTLVDEECGPCDTAEFSECLVDLNSGAVTCDNGNPVTTLSVNAHGPVLELDMSGWTAVQALMDIQMPSVISDNYSLNIGNSATNNGWSGDGSSNTNDSEVQLYNNGVQLFDSDWGTSDIVLSIPNATDLGGDLVEATVCDGYFAWDSLSAGFTEISSPNIFQIDGDESDPQAGGLNDQLLYLGVNQVVINHYFGGAFSYRDGSGTDSLTLTFWR